MADTAYDVATEKVVCITHMEHSIGLAFIYVILDSIHMHDKTFRTDFDLPFVARLGCKVVQHGEIFQVTVPPIHFAVFLIDIFVRHFGDEGVAIVLCVAADEDLGTFVVDVSYVPCRTL